MRQTFVKRCERLTSVSLFSLICTKVNGGKHPFRGRKRNISLGCPGPQPRIGPTNRSHSLQINCNKVVDTVAKNGTFYNVIKSFKHKGLAELFERGRTRRVRQDLQSRCLRRLEALDQAESLTDLKLPGFNFHGLQGAPKLYSIHVNGPWCITFEWEEGEAIRVDFEQYH